MSVPEDESEATTHATRRAARAELADVAATLLAEFSASIPAGVVIGQLALARERLLGAGVRDGLAGAAEVMARMRLRELTTTGDAG